MAATQVPHRPAPAQNHQQSDDDSDNGLLPCFSNTFPPPSLPRFRSMSPHELFCNRKRDLDEGIGNSSDTPLFSSDDLPASAEDYLAHRTKRQRKGPWWEHCSQGEPSIPRHKSKREFKRNMDSGVWMGSDSGVEEDSDLLDLNYTRSTETISDLALRTFEEPDRFDGPVFPYWEDQPPSPRYFWQNQKAAANQVRRGIDHEHHTFDLSNLGLTKLQRVTLEDLQYFLPRFRISPHDGQSSQLQLYLSNNLLTRLPGQLLRLESLTVLSLRANKLTELPPAINNLINLHELNVGNNSLRWLPYEIRDLLKRQLRLFGFHPNPFIRPMPRYKTDSRMLQHPFCCSKPALFHSDGTPTIDSPPSPTMAPAYWPGKVEPGCFVEVEPEHPERVPSLFEVCLRNLQDSPQLSQLPFLIPDDAPNSLAPALKHTWYLKQEGGQNCTICNSPFIIPRTEWIEWWQLSVPAKAEAATLDDQIPTDPDLLSDAMLIGSPVPLLRRGCSWVCVPKSAINRTGWCPAKGVATDEHLIHSSPRSRA